MIYTSIIGEIDPPRTDIKVFTDIAWFSTPRMSCRMYKVLSHLWFDESTLWVDGNIFPLSSEAEIMESMFCGSDADIAVFAHPWRSTLVDEAKEIARLAKETEERLAAFLEHHQTLPQDCRLCESGVIARRNNERVHRFNEIWWSLICRWSCRDQLTFPIAVHKSGVKVAIVERNLREVEFIRFEPHTN